MCSRSAGLILNGEGRLQLRIRNALGSPLDSVKPLKPKQPAAGRNQSPVTTHAAPRDIVKRQDARLRAEGGPSAASIIRVKVKSHFDRTLFPISSELLQSAHLEGALRPHIRTPGHHDFTLAAAQDITGRRKGIENPFILRKFAAVMKAQDCSADF